MLTTTLTVSPISSHSRSEPTSLPSLGGRCHIISRVAIYNYHVSIGCKPKQTLDMLPIKKEGAQIKSPEVFQQNERN